MSDPIFQTRSIRDASVRGVGAFAIAPLLAVLALVLVTFVIHRVGALNAETLLTSGYRIWAVMVFAGFVGLSYAAVFATLSTLAGWKERRPAVYLIVLSGIGALCFGALFWLHGASYLTVLPSSFFLLLVGIKASGMVFGQIRPYLVWPGRQNAGEVPS